MPKPKPPQITYVPPNGSSGNNLTPTMSNASLASNHTYNGDLRRDKSSSSFTPAPVISGPIPPLPKQRHHHLTSRDSSASLRDREYRDVSGSRRPPTRDPSGGSSQFNPYTIVVPPNSGITTDHSNISAPIPISSSYSHQDNLSPLSPTMSIASSLSPSSVSHMSTQSTSTSATHNTPRGSVSSSRSHEISHPIIQHHPIPVSPSTRSSLYTQADDSQSLSTTRTGRSTAEFYLERPTDDSVIEQMFNDLIVCIHFLNLKFTY